MRNAEGGGEGKGYVWGLARSEIWNMGQTELGATLCKLICGQIFPRCQNYLCMMCNNCVHKGAGVFERPGQTMDQLCIFGTSRTSNGLKSGP